MLTKLIAAAALLLAAPAAATDPVKLPCERACMEGLAGKLLTALAAHDAASLPLAKAAHYTENGQEMGFDNGLWRTASKVGAYRHVFADPASGQFGGRRADPPGGGGRDQRAVSYAAGLGAVVTERLARAGRPPAKRGIPTFGVSSAESPVLQRLAWCSLSRWPNPTRRNCHSG